MSEELDRTDLDRVREAIGLHKLVAGETSTWYQTDWPGYRISITEGWGSIEISGQYPAPVEPNRVIEVPDRSFRLLADIDGLSYKIEEILFGNWRDDVDGHGYRVGDSDEIYYD
ncbi:hypothetical protein KC878_00975 [Candidatus Saccharibacteria bacterium]|nr:hypothetical protein [Candidatus Saccharibacteria bacterium]MCB9821178.1 hypothetical protein [Candidatus Nomurabacteria bacterium]